MNTINLFKQFKDKPLLDNYVEYEELFKIIF